MQGYVYVPKNGSCKPVKEFLYTENFKCATELRIRCSKGRFIQRYFKAVKEKPTYDSQLVFKESLQKASRFQKFLRYILSNKYV